MNLKMDTPNKTENEPKVDAHLTEDFSSFPVSSLITAIRIEVDLDQLDLMLAFMTTNNGLINKSPTRGSKKMSTKLWVTLSGNLSALDPLKGNRNGKRSGRT